MSARWRTQALSLGLSLVNLALHLRQASLTAPLLLLLLFLLLLRFYTQSAMLVHRCYAARTLPVAT